MPSTSKKQTSLSLTASLVQEAQDLNINISEVSDAALAAAVRQARREAWRERHAAALSAQDDWLDRNGHPFAAIVS